MNSNRVDIVVTKPSTLIAIEKILLRKGFKRAALRTMQKQAVLDYIDCSISEKIKIPSKLLIKTNAVKEQLIIPGDYYLKLHHGTKAIPYKLNDVVVYAIFLQYQKVLRKNSSFS